MEGTIVTNLSPHHYRLSDLPEFQRFQEANPGKELREKQTALMYARAIHWLSICEILWPDFEKHDYYYVEVKYLAVNDPDEEKLPTEFYNQVAEILSMFWHIKLNAMYPNGEWEVEIHDDAEMTVDATIGRRD